MKVTQKIAAVAVVLGGTALSVIAVRRDIEPHLKVSEVFQARAQPFRANWQVKELSSLEPRQAKRSSLQRRAQVQRMPTLLANGMGDPRAMYLAQEAYRPSAPEVVYYPLSDRRPVSQVITATTQIFGGPPAGVGFGISSGVSGQRGRSGLRVGGTSTLTVTNAQLGSGRLQTGSLSSLTSSLGTDQVVRVLAPVPLNLGTPLQSPVVAQAAGQAAPQPTPEGVTRIGVFSLYPSKDDGTQIRRIRDDKEERVATSFTQGDDVTVIFDGPSLEEDWSSLIGELFLFTTAPSLSGEFVDGGFEVTRIPDGSMLLAGGIRKRDVLVAIDGVPVDEIEGFSLPISAIEGQFQVELVRDEKALLFSLVRGRVPLVAVTPVVR